MPWERKECILESNMTEVGIRNPEQENEVTMHKSQFARFLDSFFLQKLKINVLKYCFLMLRLSTGSLGFSSKLNGVYVMTFQRRKMIVIFEGVQHVAQERGGVSQRV